MSKKMRNTLIKIIVSASLLGYLFFKEDPRILIANFRLMNPVYIPLIIGLFLLNYLISSVRWKLLLVHKGGEKAKIPFLTSLYFVGSFFNNFMPTSIGGDVYKIFKLGQKIESNADAFSATFMERFTGMLALVVIAYIGLIYDLDFWISTLPVSIKSNEILVQGLEFSLFIGFWILSIFGFMSMKFIASKVEMVHKVYTSLLEYINHKKVLLSAFLTSFFVQILAVFTQFYVFKALGFDIPLSNALFIFPVIFLASFFIPSVNGLGVQDFLYRVFFPLLGLGITQSVAVSVSLIYHLLRLLVSLIGGILYAIGKEN